MYLNQIAHSHIFIQFLFRFLFLKKVMSFILNTLLPFHLSILSIKNYIISPKIDYPLQLQNSKAISPKSINTNLLNNHTKA